mmetsp:Transcript_6885/g.20098  ORF Transcript_6885/g.20098 Transcript_6885/m.20098 type:complete len:362 (-) Transcript_6885:73-1158(-)
MREVGPVLHEDLVEDHPPLGGPHLGHSPRQVHVGLPLRFVAVVLRNPLDAVHVDLELRHLPHHPRHEAGHVHRGRDGEPRHPRRVGGVNRRHQGGGEGDTRAQVFQPDRQPPVGADEWPIGPVGFRQQHHVLPVKVGLQPERPDDREALERLHKVGEDGGHGQGIQSLELPAGADVEQLHPQVEQGDRDDHQDHQRSHPAHNEHGEESRHRAHRGRVQRLADRGVQGLGVPREPVDQPPGRLGVKEGHGKGADLCQQPRVHRLGGREGPVRHGERPQAQETDGRGGQERVEHQVVLDAPPAVVLLVAPVGENKVLPDLQAPLRERAADKDDREDQVGAARADVLHVHGLLHPSLAPLLRLD